MADDTRSEEDEIKAQPVGALAMGIAFLPLLLFLPMFRALPPVLFWMIAGGMGAALLAGMGGLWKFYADNVVIGTARGLRWKRWRGTRTETNWQEAGWEQVADFYDAATTCSPLWEIFFTPDCVIKLRDGRTIAFGREWRNGMRLRDRIVSRSVNAEGARLPDGTIGWALEGARPSDLPTSFSYPEATIRRKLRAANLRSIVIVLAAVAFNTYWLLTQGTGSWVLPALTLAGLGIEAYNWWSGRKPWKDAQRRQQRGEQIEATAEGLVIRQEGERQTIPWDSIVGYELPFVLSRFTKEVGMVRSITGQEFTFTPAIDDYYQLGHVLRLFARDAVEYRRAGNEKHAIGGMELRWTGGEEGKGDRVFHARTRLNRGLLWMFWGMGGVSGLVTVLFPYLHAKEGKSAPLILPVLGVVFCVFACGQIIQRTREYFTDGVTFGKESIRLKDRGKLREVRWDAIAVWRLELGRVYIEGADGTKLDFNPYLYAYGSELPDLIRERMEQSEAAAERAASAADVACTTWSGGSAQAESPQIVLQRER